MTFSIVARSADGRSFGVAVASRFLAVGALVPAAWAGVGALATQSLADLVPAAGADPAVDRRGPGQGGGRADRRRPGA